MFELLLSLLMLAMPANFPSSRVVDSKLVADAVVSVHDDAAVSMVGLVLPEKVLVCSVADGFERDSPQGQNPAPVSSLQTTWKAADNTSHTVTTPIVSTTPAGLERAIQLHTDLVRSMKIIYPPVP